MIPIPNEDEWIKCTNAMFKETERNWDMRKAKEGIVKSKVNTIPMRMVKMITAFILFWPLMWVMFSFVCFEKNEWPWRLQP